ncbi:hypothetical protein [Oxynema aestuarii]|jgi:hypothetical protein|uniref:Uncharacterized protein n=1 Tax=Oxynema aestuarii AP17 TaxID=2064643 RepID=A0A6H1TV71_9CYAN|nr:hypothetical protein [Oxynema aestuarii]QIZ70508.1 hypothetical protein HCG48_07880 [Oxynema aestuarii AP17]
MLHSSREANRYQGTPLEADRDWGSPRRVTSSRHLCRRPPGPSAEQNRLDKMFQELPELLASLESFRE